MNKNKPSRWYYLLAILLPIFACAGTSFFVYAKVPKLPGALEDLGIKNLTRVVVPGTAEIDFPEPGAYAVYYEYRGVIDGVRYDYGEYPPYIRCQLKSKSTGSLVSLAPSSVKGNVYNSHSPERSAVVFKFISIDQPGRYNFSCKYPDGRPFPRIVMAVGPNLIYEFLNVAVKPIAATLSGTFAFLIACGISLLIVVFVAYKRRQSKNTLLT